MSSGYGPPAPKEVAVARPSSSVLLISPKNEILLLHRVRGASSFASAHVFPGGNVDSFHDGQEPASSDSARHVDGPVYRRAAIRETFEESGILLARNNGFGRLIEVDDVEREEGRRLVHEGKVSFEKWLASKGGRADVGERIFRSSLEDLARLISCCRRPDPFHTLGHTSQFTTTLHDTNVSILSTHRKSARSERLDIRSRGYRW